MKSGLIGVCATTQEARSCYVAFLPDPPGVRYHIACGAPTFKVSQNGKQGRGKDGAKKEDK